MNRISKTEYYLNIAREASKRSTCLRRNYGSARGEQNCCDIYDVCPRANQAHNSGNYGDCPAVHAEQNAMLSAPRDKLMGATIYLAGYERSEDGTVYPMMKCEPCPICARMIKNAGIATIVAPTGVE